MNILALSPFHGGSHAAFLDGWIARSRHDFTLLSLPDRRWKWRMRHAALTFARDAEDLLDAGASFDCVLATDMLDLAAFKGLAPPALRAVLTIAYFHESQFTYPARHDSEPHAIRDHHFAYTNFTTAAAANVCWFNSEFHKAEFLRALPDFLARFPDHHHTDEVELIASRAAVQYPGIDEIEPRDSPRNPGPLRVAWAARWEHDKNPDDFFAAVRALKTRDIPFQLAVLGRPAKTYPSVFDHARAEFADHIINFGDAESKGDYITALRSADVIVSTANHEFCGVSILEAAATGAVPILPRRLAYPELFDDQGPDDPLFYEGDVTSLTDRLNECAADPADLEQLRPRARAAVEPFLWSSRTPALDEAIETVSVETRSAR